MIVRLFCICSGLLLVFAGAVFGEGGTYQRTKDGKTIVWNNDPKPGDAATWFGDRDGEGYATKIGTLTWYTANGAVYARYFGNMVRGKFDGMVNVHSKGKTDHAIFVDGQRTTRWAAGRAPSLRVAHSRAQRPAKPAATPKPAPGVAEPAAPAEGPPAGRETANTQRPTSNVQRPTPAKEISLQRAPPPKPPATPEPDSGMAEPEARAAGGRTTVTEEKNAQRPTLNIQRPTPANELSLQPAPHATPAATTAPTSGVAEPEVPAVGPPIVTEAEQAQRPTSNIEHRTPNAVARQGEQAEQAAQPPTPAKEIAVQRAPPKPPATPEPASAVAEPEAPAEGPAAGSETANAQRSTPAKEIAVHQAPPTTPEATAEPASGVAEPEAPAEGPRVVQAESAQPATPSSESSREQAAQPPIEDTPSVLIEASKESVPTPPTSKKSQAEVEDSLQSLVRPPSSLPAIPETTGPAAARPRLTKEEVINIANAEARTHGYNRADYERAEPHYDAAYKIWSVSYEQSVVGGMEEAVKPFSVIVDDKTKGTVFVPRK